MSMMHSSESRRAPEIMERIRLASGSRFSLYVLVCLHIIICCTSLAQVAHWQSYMLFDAARINYAIAAVLSHCCSLARRQDVSRSFHNEVTFDVA